MEIRPQPKQEHVLACDSDIAIMGGAAGGGKTYALLMEPLYHCHVPGFTAVIFRRIHPMIVAEGGIWDESLRLYPGLQYAPKPKVGDLSWEFPGGATVRFSHLQYEHDVLTWYSSQIPLIEFDQLEQFTRQQFFEMLTRNRSTCGVRPYVRASCNPDPDSFLVDFLAWWIGEDGYAIPDRAGQTRWFIRLPSDELAWDDSAEALIKMYGSDVPPMSVTFFPMMLEDNPALTSKDPNYRAKLLAQPQYLRDRLLGGNWKARPTAGQFFKRHWFDIVDGIPADCRKVRFWDLAATEPTPASPDPDYTVGMLEAMDQNGYFYYADIRRDRVSPGAVEHMILHTAEQDGRDVQIGIEQEPGASGKITGMDLGRKLAARGFHVRIYPKRIKTELAAGPLSSAAELGSVRLVRSAWNKLFLDELESFPGAKHDDQVVAATGAHGILTKTMKGELVGQAGRWAPVGS
jgi:predicted phage terminase large subunit-like protein